MEIRVHLHRVLRENRRNRRNCRSLEFGRRRRRRLSFRCEWISAPAAHKRFFFPPSNVGSPRWKKKNNNNNSVEGTKNLYKTRARVIESHSERTRTAGSEQRIGFTAVFLYRKSWIFFFL